MVDAFTYTRKNVGSIVPRAWEIGQLKSSHTMDERCQDKHLMLCALNVQLRLNTKACIMGTNVSLMLTTVARCWFPCLGNMATGSRLADMQKQTVPGECAPFVL